jgi:hypothetical protein
MRLFLLIGFAAMIFFAATAVATHDASAYVCARGVYRAGCAGPRGAVVVRRAPVVVRPAVVCRYVWVNGVRVRRCI